MKQNKRRRAHALGTNRRVVGAILAIALLILSVTVLQPALTSVGTYAGCIDALDGKRETVMNLAAAATAASAAITVIPDDIGTPIADKLADLSFYLMVILGMLYLEKYLLTIIGWATTAFLVPAGSLLLLGYYLRPDRANLARLAARLLVVSLVLVLAIPVSLQVSDLIERTYRDSIDETIALASDVEEPAGTQGSGQTFWEKITGAASKMVHGVSETVDWAKHVLNNFMEAIAVLLVTDCVIPVLVLLFFLWLARSALHLPANRASRR